MDIPLTKSAQVSSTTSAKSSENKFYGDKLLHSQHNKANKVIYYNKLDLRSRRSLILSM